MVRRAPVQLQLALLGGAAVSILAGASFNIQGHSGESGVVAILAGVLAFASGLIYPRWERSLAALLASLLVAAALARFNLHERSLPVNLTGLLCLGLGGALGRTGYDSLTRLIRNRVRELESLNARLEEQHRIFLAATDETTLGSDDLAQMAVSTAAQVGARICGYYLAGPDGAEFLPQLPGLGLDRLKARPVSRRGTDPPPWLLEIEAGRMVEADDPDQLRGLFTHLPPGWSLEQALVVPIRAGDQIGGILLLANKPGGFGEDDRRLATTLALRAGAGLASVRAVALSRQETARYQLLNDFVKEAAGLSFEAVLDLLMERGRQLVRHDAGRVALFRADGAFTLRGGTGVPVAIAGSPLQAVREGRSVVRQAVTVRDGLLSGLAPSAEGGTISEALVPIRGEDAVLGAICLGRRQASGFSERDVPRLDELGAMAGVAIENSRMLAQVSGQATKLDTALDALGQISHALTSVTEGTAALERKTLEAAGRLEGAPFALIARCDPDGGLRVSTQIGFPALVDGREFKPGEGVVGAVARNQSPVALADAAASWDLADTLLLELGVRAALCVPMREAGSLWGVLAVFDSRPRGWSADDIRVVQTLASEAVVAIKNAELYDRSGRLVWELTNLHEGLKAMTETLDLEQVLENVLNWAARASGAQTGCLALTLEPGPPKVFCAHGTDREAAAQLALGAGRGLVAEVLRSGLPQLQTAAGPPAGGPLDPRSLLCVPISLREHRLGVVLLASDEAGDGFGPDHQRLVAALAAQAAVAIDNARLFRDRDELMLATLEALVNTVDARDPYTAGHSHRVTEYCLIVARQLDYRPGDQAAWRALRQGAMLHDLGKIAIPDAVLAKPGRLTEGELELVRKHPVVGFNVLSGLRMLTDELTIVRSHHERFDGLGYPDGAAGGGLPLCAWIVGAADALDAMTSDRPYRRAMPLADAVEEIVRGAGTQFHPDVAAAFAASVAAGRLRVLPQTSLFTDAPGADAFQNPVP